MIQDSIDFSPADRIGNVKEYYFSVKRKEIDAMNGEGADVINLGIGSPDLPPSMESVTALSESARLPDSHGYQPYTGIPELRNGFSDFYKREYGVELDPKCEILPLMGSKEGIMHISMAFVNPGDGVLVPNPGYPTYTSVSRLVGADVHYYPLKEENGWYPDFEELEREDARGMLDLSRIKLMWCNYPNMPTGADGSEEVFRKFVEFGRKHKIIICHDNPYSFILTERPLSILSVPGAKDICIELNSMSKTFNMPGWRIGMLASNRKFVEWILRVKSNMDSGMFRPMQLAAVKALESPEEWHGTMNRIYSERKDLAVRILEAAGADVRPGQVGLFLWGRVKDCNRCGKGNKSSGEIVCDTLLYKSHVFLTPGFIFGSEGDDYIRISLCCNVQMLGKALERVENCGIYNKKDN
ncbi:MAG: aminotransferase class I/II-fold pyridoxal phosphate-dependent enzyme [Bacteroidales bacterium]|jgi:aspartate/methionine/tyrosine aminotransferase|nr:aminotransferase class I/II-fold pyridoxal phosphate-dependent enzyme [Bacteroidales bacterium]